ncbi:MAG TPA: PCRF domain-containing protein, partial [Acidimicrobiia bacterium]|nr:PCRF domain-containing protein [Acidimicrobiia bacterium]
MRDFTDPLAAIRRRVEDARGYLQIDAKRERVAELSKQSAEPDLWDDPDRARQLTTELARLEDDVQLVDRLAQQLADAETLHELGRDEGDTSFEGEVAHELDELADELDQLELRALFTGDHDERDAICDVHSGAGGTDAQDWTQMLFRMLTRWAERRGFEVEVDAVQPGTEAGITSATFTVKGRYAYGLLTSERGVHRLIRISPFDANARRQTAFAAVEVTPDIED